MKKLKIGYKVVSINEEGHYWSSSAPFPAAKRYRRDCFTKRAKEHGPLAVFRSKKFARDFGLDFGGAIFQCEYMPSVDTALWDKAECVSLLELPSGTAFADKVRLLERIR